MTPRLKSTDAPAELMQAMRDLNAKVDASGLEKLLLELVKIRVSQINGCAYCVHLHARLARAAGETAERLNMIAVWRESSAFTARERAALAWAESATLVAQTHVPDAEHAAVRKHFSETEWAQLTFVVAVINAWNRLAMSFRWAHPAGGFGEIED